MQHDQQAEQPKKKGFLGLFRGLTRSRATATTEPQSRHRAPMAPLMDDHTRQHMIEAIDRPVSHANVTVSSMKGGIGKTSSILALGTALGRFRREQPAAIDANPSRGTLAERLGEEHALTVQDLLAHASQIESVADVRPFMSVAGSRLAVIASEKSPDLSREFTADDYAEAREIMRHFFQIVLTDTGTDVTKPVIDEIAAATDVLVIPATATADGYRLAEETLKWWHDHAPNGPQLVANAVVVLTALDYSSPTVVEIAKGVAEGTSTVEELNAEVDRWEQARVAKRDRVAADLMNRHGVGAVVPVPYDVTVAQGHIFKWEELAPATQDAYVALAYEVASRFPAPHEVPQRAFQPAVDGTEPPHQQQPVRQPQQPVQQQFPQQQYPQQQTGQQQTGQQYPQQQPNGYPQQQPQQNGHPHPQQPNGYPHQQQPQQPQQQVTGWQDQPVGGWGNDQRQ